MPEVKQGHRHLLKNTNLFYNYIYYAREIILFFILILILLRRFKKKNLIFIVYIIFGFIMIFFRNPKIEIKENSNNILTPVSGKIENIKELRNFYKIHIYMSPLDPHILTAPISGKIKLIKDIKRDKDEERILVIINRGKDTEVKIEQAVRKLGITGWMSKFLISKRILINLDEGQKIYQGERYGIIRFGSEIQLYVPKNFNLLIKEGDKCKIGKTIIAKKL